MPDWLDTRTPIHDRRRAERYLAGGSWSDRTTVERLREVCARHAGRDAVAGPDGSLTYRELDERTDRIAAGLIALGLPRGAPVVVQIGNSTESVLAFYALLKCGAVPVAALPAHRAHEIGPISAAVGAVAHLVDAEASKGALIPLARDNAAGNPAPVHLLTVGPAPAGFTRVSELGADVPADRARAQVDAVQDRIHHEDVAVFQLSGGTTGTPKLIPRLHAEYWNNAVANSRALGRTPASRIGHVLPLLHNAGVINALFGAHVVGGCFVAVPFGRAAETMRLLIEHRVNDMMIGGPMASWLDEDPWDELASALEVVIFSGSKLPRSLFDACTARGIWMGQTWGMAEGPYTSTRRTDPPGVRSATVGSPVYGADDEMLIVDPVTHVPLPAGETGMLVFRGPSTLAGYFDAPGHNRAAFTAEGLLLTGDLARLVERDGGRHLSIEGRLKDVISRGGEKFSTEEVEKLLLQHPSIAEAAVVAMPDERLGERACAYLVPAEGLTAPSLTDVQKHFEGLGVAKYKWPERLELLPALPRTATYKVNKVLLRTLAAELGTARDA
ncbi:2,3-dihydroxybenzoate-AMP ligase [Actinoplanes sp. NBRC 14428]|uniref:Non-ribosomal peptide synthetase component E (Peptide arylation enzyme) n=1 Tax=Pseudosporangium ferrugineum TaxID=439699 RepID=A0A2T0SBP2_9ACTN|nr:AMP-binding protein [Pseudosporangium ferrugineum]PRY30822.1 non-ribosomal peptide synthetase component E (peptide arylation enzyme) [Pseudosporangium ferrugineum]BCJ50381.1 2,3-dihydroxybenzoate-AMP ligase [Actinoplanes sp. NBRC 14428]